MLHDNDKVVRINAATSLGMLGNKSGFPVAIKMLNDKSAVLRTLACKSLSNIGEKKSAIPSLEKLLDDPDSRVKREAKRTLTRLGWKPPVKTPKKTKK